MTDDSRQAGKEIEITDAMIEAGQTKIFEWAERYGVDDLPATGELALRILEVAQCQFRLDAGLVV